MFYAVGVGPGDPMWMTREACAVLETCPVIAAPQTASGEMLALSIAQGAAELGGKTVLPLSFAMSRDAAVRAAGYPITVEPNSLVIADLPARIAFCVGPLHEEIEFFAAG